MFYRYINEENRQVWLKKTLYALSSMQGILGALYFKLRGGRQADDLACFGWQCVAVKS